MDKGNRRSGGGLVRIDALKARYKRAKKESGLEEALAAELTAQGWDVTRQVWCRPMNEGWRRIDIYAFGFVWGYRARVPVTLGIEIKDEGGIRVVREAYAQLRRYREAAVWCTPEGESLHPPSWFAYTSRFLLGGAEYGTGVGELGDRFLWDIGASALRRGWDGNLCLNMRFPAFHQRGGRTIPSTADPEVRLTSWQTERTGGEG